MTNEEQINESVPAADNMLPMSREHSSDKTRCLVTFRLPGEAAPLGVAAGANVLVAGTSVFGDGKGVAAGMDRLRTSVKQEAD
jgi:hypothetical protein